MAQHRPGARCERPAVATRLRVKVIAGARRGEILGWSEETLRVRVAAAPERGKANAALVALLARALGLPARAVRLIAGAGTPRKVIEVHGCTASEVRARLAQRGAAATGGRPME